MGLLDSADMMRSMMIDPIPVRPVEEEKNVPEEKSEEDNASVAATEQPEPAPTESPTTQKPENVEVGESDNKEKQIVERPKRQKVVQTTMKKKSDFVQIRDFPRSLMSAVRSEFPGANSNIDALAAYVLVKTNADASTISDEVKQLALEYDGDRTAENIEKRLENLEKQNREMLSLLKELELVVAFLTFDRFGFRQDNPKDVRSVDLLENGVESVLTRIREQATILRKQENIKNGRPIR